MRRAWTMASMLIGVASPTAVFGQDVVRIAGDETYCGCRVTLEHVVTLGDTAGPGMLLGEIKHVQRDAGGVYHVLAWTEHQIYRFTPEGRALPPLLEKGEGPGEALRLDHFAIVADSLVVFDNGNARMAVFDPEGEEVRTMPTHSYIPDAEYLPEVGVLVNGRGLDAGSFGRLFHLFDTEGRHVRSFGGEPRVGRDPELTWVRNIARSGDAIWSAPEHRYELERWSLAGTRTHVIEREKEWFEPRLHASWGGPYEPAEPLITDLSVDARGYLRVLIVRGGPRWAELLSLRPSASRRRGTRSTRPRSASASSSRSWRSSIRRRVGSSPGASWSPSSSASSIRSKSSAISRTTWGGRRSPSGGWGSRGRGGPPIVTDGLSTTIRGRPTRGSRTIVGIMADLT